MTIINALTINVEDYFQAPAFQRSIKESDWGLLSPRIEYAVDKLLLLLSDHHVTATFFVYGWTVTQYPSMLKKIVEQGHELAYRHYSPPESLHFNQYKIIDDIKRYKDLLAQIGGQRVTGFRCSSELCDLTSDWLSDELILAGYEYSCENHAKKMKGPKVLIPSLDDNFQHIHISTHQVLTRPVDIINTYSIRTRRYESTRKLVSRHIEDTKTPVLGNISTWLMDNLQPNIRGDSLLNEWLHRYRTKEAPLILHQLFSEYGWQKISDIYLHKILQLNSFKNRKGRCVS